MREPDFKKATQKATELLCEQDLKFDRVLNVRNLKYDKHVVFDSIQNYCMLTRTPVSTFLDPEKKILHDGCSLFDKRTGIYIVLNNDEVHYFEHANWTLAHEIGHIYLDHENDGRTEEIEAHHFAAQLFMPEYTIYQMGREYGKVTAKDLVEIFGVSPEAAQRRINSMNKRCSISSSKHDINVWEMQEERIGLYYRCKESGEDYRYSLLQMEEYYYANAYEEILAANGLFYAY